jgi:hypothetical protein
MMTNDQIQKSLLALGDRVCVLENSESFDTKGDDGEVILNRRVGTVDRRTEKARMFRQWMWTGASIGSGVSCRRGNYKTEKED